jgi:hypothetical protein
MGTIDVLLTKTREEVLSVLMPLPNARHDLSNNGRCRVKGREVSLQFLHGQGEDDICPCAFAFDHMPCGLVLDLRSEDIRSGLGCPSRICACQHRRKR